MADEQSDAEQIRAELENMSRLPFRRELAVLLENPTDPEALKGWANKSPDRRGQLLAILGRLSGYTERQAEPDAGVMSLAVRVKQMSDAQLLRELAKSEAKLAALHAGPKRKALKPPRKRKKAGGPEK